MLANSPMKPTGHAVRSRGMLVLWEAWSWRLIGRAVGQMESRVLVIREMRIDDVSSVALLVDRSFASESGDIPPATASEEAVRRWQSRLVGDGCWAVVGEIDTFVVGVCHGSPERDLERGVVIDGVAHLTSLAVDPGWWGMGFGHGLLAAGEERMRDLGFRRARLWASPRTERAVRLYRSHGWMPTGRVGTDDVGVEIVEYELAL